MILSQVTDNENGTRTIHQHIERVICVEFSWDDRVLYITSDNLTEVQSIDKVEGQRITIKGDFK